jgi:hypothetical protein
MRKTHRDAMDTIDDRVIVSVGELPRSFLLTFGSEIKQPNEWQHDSERRHANPSVTGITPSAQRRAHRTPGKKSGHERTVHSAALLGVQRIDGALPKD